MSKFSIYVCVHPGKVPNFRGLVLSKREIIMRGN